MKKVLIMEDELNIRSFVVINLKRAGYDAIEAGTGQEALDKIRDNYDYIFNYYFSIFIYSIKLICIFPKYIYSINCC